MAIDNGIGGLLKIASFSENFDRSDISFLEKYIAPPHASATAADAKSLLARRICRLFREASDRSPGSEGDWTKDLLLRLMNVLSGFDFASPIREEVERSEIPVAFDAASKMFTLKKAKFKEPAIHLSSKGGTRAKILEEHERLRESTKLQREKLWLSAEQHSDHQPLTREQLGVIARDLWSHQPPTLRLIPKIRLVRIWLIDQVFYTWTWRRHLHLAHLEKPAGDLLRDCVDLAKRNFSYDQLPFCSTLFRYEEFSEDGGDTRLCDVLRKVTHCLQKSNIYSFDDLDDLGIKQETLKTIGYINEKTRNAQNVLINALAQSKARAIDVFFTTKHLAFTAAVLILLGVNRFVDPRLLYYCSSQEVMQTIQRYVFPIYGEDVDYELVTGGCDSPQPPEAEGRFLSVRRISELRDLWKIIEDR